jgi:hypothetical protein
MGGYVYLPLTSLKMVILDRKFLFIQKNLVGRHLVARSNFDHYIYFSPYSRNYVRQTTFQPKRHSIGK